MLKISFEFDEITQKVSNLKVTSCNSESNSKTYDVEVDENKLNLTSEAINKLGVVAGDRISVNYWTENNQTTYPIISKSDVFTDGADGNKVTKKGTISFKGQQRASLLKFGSLFTFSEFKDKNGNVMNNVFILTPVEDEDDNIAQLSDLIEENESITELDNNSVEQDIAEMLGDDDHYVDALPF